jgi:CBS domain containing-hemolysin-like protein
MSLGTAVLVLVAVLTVEAFFSGSEIALVHADRLGLRRAAADGDTGARRALGLLEDEASLIATCLIGTNLAIVTGTTLFTNLLLQLHVENAWMLALGWVPFGLVLGEALPKTLFQHHADALAPRVAGPLSTARRVFAPALAVVRGWNRTLSAVFGAGQVGYLTREELLGLLDGEGEDSPIAPEERRLIRGVLELRTTTVFDAMTPLVQVVAVAEGVTVGFAVEVATRTQHSRLPVYRGRIDAIVGMVHQADLLFAGGDAEPLAPLVRPVPFVPETKSAKALFEAMRTEGDHFAVVVDEYGGCVGIVTLEDLLERLVGEIEDERDVPEAALVRQADGSWSVPAQIPLASARALCDVPLPDGPYETLAGLVLHRLGHIPARGEQVHLEGVVLTVEDASERAIVRLRLRPPESPADPTPRPGPA